jgi:hypothetical protein
MSEGLDWLDDLKRLHPARSVQQPDPRDATGVTAPNGTSVGGIYRAVAMDHDQRPCLVIVTDTDESVRSATVVLLSPEVEMGGDRDLLLAPERTGLAYEVIAQAEIFGYVWLVQLGKKVGRVDTQTLAQLAELQNPEPALLEIDLRSGPPIVARSDVRWRFKLAELARLQGLSGPCTRQMIDGEPKVSVDPMAFRPPAAETDPLELLEYLVKLTELSRKNRVDLPAWVLEAILDDEFVRAWNQHGLSDAYSSLVALATQALSGLKSESIPTDNRENSPGGLTGLRVQVLADRRSQGVTSVPLLAICEAGTHPDVEKVVLPDGSLIQCVTVRSTVRSHETTWAS